MDNVEPSQGVCWHRNDAATCPLCKRETLEWLPIATAPELERVWVAGVQPRSGRCIAYWWWEEDCVSDGKAIEKPYATHWARIILPAKFPYSAEQVPA